MTENIKASGGAIAIALIYLTFFLDNVLLTVLVPIIPDWVRGESLALWATNDAPLAALLNTTVHKVTHEPYQEHGSSGGAAQAVVGAVLGAKAATQLACAPLAANAVCRHGPARVLRAATALLAVAALVFAACGRAAGAGGGAGAAWCAGAGRVAHGAGAAGAGVAGLALAAAAAPQPHTARALGLLLGAVALGVLVGYPFGGAAYALWDRATPFILVSIALVADVVMSSEGVCAAWVSARSAARRPPAAACAGAVLLTTSVMATLEPCLPLWIMRKFHSQAGAVFVPDSGGYLVAASVLGGAARRLGAERVALAGQLAVGLAALAVPHATSVGALALPHAALGAGLGAADAALVPALLARSPRRLPQRAALLHAAASAAYALGPVVGGAVSWAAGFETTMRLLGVLNLLYAALLYRALANHPLSEQWGASAPDDSSEDGEDSEDGAMLPPLEPHGYRALP